MNDFRERLFRLYRGLVGKERTLLWIAAATVALLTAGFLIIVDAQDFHDTFQGLAGLFTVIAIIIGGYWALFQFNITRTRYPRADLTHQISHRPIPNSKMLLTVILTIRNQGQVGLNVRSGFTRIQLMVPLPD